MSLSPQELILNLGELPPLPRVASQVLGILSDSDSSAEELQRIVSTDQALTAQILKVANSAMFGMVREVTTLSQAVMTLGFSTTRSVAIAASVKNLYARGSVGIQEQVLWEHALVSALTGSAYGKLLKFPHVEEIFLGALLHDIGKKVLSLKFPEAYGSILRRLAERGGDGLALEGEAFGFDHAQVGEALLRSWNLAPRIEAAARWHHDPMEAPGEHRRLVALVALGNRMALELEVGQGDPDSLAGATRQALLILGRDEEALAAYREEVLAAVEKDKALITDF